MFENTYLSSTPPTQSKFYYSITLNIGINKILMPTDYTIQFIDNGTSGVNTWATFLKVDDLMISDAYPLSKPDGKVNKFNTNNDTIYTYHSPTSISVLSKESIDDMQNIEILPGVNDTMQIIAKDPGVYYHFSTTLITTFTDNDIIITIPPAVYSRDFLIRAINTQIQNVIIADTNLTKIIPIESGEYFKLTTRANSGDNNLLYLNINIYVIRKYTTADYNLVFYDNLSFVTCFTGGNSVRNTVWDTTLGWILGFRTYTVYDLSIDQFNESSEITVSSTGNVISVFGDTGLTTNLYNYFLLSLDDFNQNHLNDGLVTITNNDISVPLPSYANRTDFICNPATGQVEYTNTDGLTEAQIYTLNAINNTKVGGNSIGTSIPSSSYGAGSFVKDVFGLIPIKTNGLKAGDTFVEYGGTLQNQSRTYFGPVNIHRMAVKLISDRGDVVNLNRANWSFSLVCEQLNRINPS
jgi:hypothetical protein